MPDNLRVIPWEQFNTYNQEIMEKVESLDTTNANENDVLTYTGNNITWQAPVSELPSGGMAGDVLTWSGDTFEWVKGLPEGADEETRGKVLTYTGGTGKYSWESPFPYTGNTNGGEVLMVTDDNGHVDWAVPEGKVPSTENVEEGAVLTYDGSNPRWEEPQPGYLSTAGGNLNDILTIVNGSNGDPVANWASSPMPSTEGANNGDVLTYTDDSGARWSSPFPSTENIDNDPKVLTYASEEGFYWDTKLPSGANRGDVLTYTADSGGYVWRAPQSELPSMNNASEGDVLTYNGSNLEWATPQSGGLPETPSDQPALLTTDPSGSLSWLPAEGNGGHYTSGIPYVQCDGHFHWVEQPSGDGQYVLVVQASDNDMRYFWEPYNN